MAAYDVVLLPSFAQVESWRKRQADSAGPGLFSQTVTTFDAWIADLWDLFGDGRAIVGPLQREVLMQVAFAQLAEGGASPDGGPSADAARSPGMVALAADCARLASGLPAFDRAVETAAASGAVEGMSARESALLATVGHYRRLAEDAGFVEFGHACAWLAHHAEGPLARPTRVLVEDAAPLSWIEEAFFAACGDLSVDVRPAPGAGRIGERPCGARLRFGFPSGRYAQPALVADLVREALAERSAGHVAGAGFEAVVTCKDPLAMYRQFEGALAAAGLDMRVQARVPFHATDFGRQYLQVARAAKDDPWNPSDLSDAARSPFSGFGAADALEIDKALRADRLAQAPDCLARLRAASDAFSQLEELATDPEADILLGVFEQMAFNAPGRSAAWRAEQLAAVSALRSCTATARLVGGRIEDCLRVVEKAQVGISFESRRDAEGAGSAEAARGRVTVTTQQVAAQMGEAACDALFVCDLTADDYPVADKDDAATALFAKLGLVPPDSALARARRAFASLQGLPTESLCCLRPLNDWDGNPTYPCAVLQELIDAYRAGSAPEDDADAFGLPARLSSSVVQRGEELLFANASAASPGSVQPVWGQTHPSWAHGDSASRPGRIALPRSGGSRGPKGGFAPSPSQVEAYLECPRKWFVQSRIKAEELDEGFGALERGTFAHEVLQRFYRQFREAGHAKVLPSNLPEAKALMRAVADEAAAGQYRVAPGGTRYVAANQIELREVRACVDQLVAYLDVEARLLPRFEPTYFEHAFSIEDGIEYAGRPFVGIVDRIDVDDTGNAVVIDYKGSVGKAHQIAGKTDGEPGKVQTRMYAQAVRRALGLNVVGALYLSYGKAHACAGAFDPRALEAAHLPYVKPEACSCAAASPPEGERAQEHAALSFADMLDRTEEVVARAIAAMEAGVIAPAPSSPESCAHCPADTCPLRQA